MDVSHVGAAEVMRVGRHEMVRRKATLGLSLAVSLTLSLAGPWPAAARSIDAPAAAVGEHPRLFFSSQDIPRLREEAATTHREIWQPILAFATSQLSAIPPSTSGCPNLDGFRNAGNQLVAFAFAYVITGDRQYFELTRRHLVAYASWEYWGDESACGDVDLGHAHMLQGNAIAYDWVYNDLTEADRVLISQNLARRAQQSYEASSAEQYIMGNWWRTTYMQNHHWTNHAALGIAALVLEGEDSRASAWLDQAISQLSHDRDVAEGIGDGSWHEGIPYQSYGLTMALPFSYNLRRIKGLDIIPHTYLQNYAYWRVYNSLPGTWHYALSHGDFAWSWGDSYAPQNILRLVAREHRDGHAEWAAQHIIQYAGRSVNVWFAPFYVFEFLYYDSSVAPQPPDGLPLDRTFPDLEGVVWRTGWGADDLTFALKSGPYAGRFAFDRFLRGEYPFDHPVNQLSNDHDHQDTNSFYLYWGGVDLASEAVIYGGTEASYHNTLQVDGAGQYEDPDTFNGHNYWDQDPDLFRDADGKLESVVGGQSFSYLIADATNRYRLRDPATGAPGVRLVQEFKRHVLFDRSGYLVMADNIRASAAHRFEWVSHFGAAATLDGDWIKSQGQDGKTLGVKVLSPSGFAVTTGNDGKAYVRLRPGTDVSSTRFIVVLFPMNGANWATRPQVSSLGAAGGTVGVRVELNGTRDHLIRLEGQGLVQVGSYSFDGQVASIVRGPDGQLGKLFVAGGSQLVDNGLARTLLQTSDGDPVVEIEYEGTGLTINASGFGTLRVYAPEADTGQVTLNGQPAQTAKEGEYIVVGGALAPSFADVPTSHTYFREIEALYRAGYTAGCNTKPLMYCPDQTMNRAESAVFVERGIHTATYDPPVPSGQVFADMPLDSWAAKWVNGLWADQYTAGCGTNPLIYCPWQGHTRAEGCVFYLRMLRGAGYEPPQPSRQTFGDVPLESWYAKWVQAAYDVGLITECQASPELRFCPEDPLFRGLAAYMMVHAKGLTLP